MSGSVGRFWKNSEVELVFIYVQLNLDFTPLLIEMSQAMARLLMGIRMALGYRKLDGRIPLWPVAPVCSRDIPRSPHASITGHILAKFPLCQGILFSSRSACPHALVTVCGSRTLFLQPHHRIFNIFTCIRHAQLRSSDRFVA